MKHYIFFLLCILTLTICSCKNKYDPKTAVVVQDKFERTGISGHWYKISYREVNTAKLGITHIGKYDFEHCIPGDTLYIKIY